MLPKKILSILVIGLSLISGCDENEEEGSSAISISPNADIFLMENGEAENYVVKLNDKPSSEVVVSLFIVQQDIIHVSTSSLLITPEHWSEGAAVAVNCVDNALITGNRTAVVIFNTSSADHRFNGQTQTRNVVCIDDEQSGQGEPVPPVQTNPDPTTPTNPDPTTPTKPGTPGHKPGGPGHKPENPGMILPGGSLVVTPDNGNGSFVITSAGELVTSEDGMTDDFEVALDKLPDAPVVVNIKSMDESEGIVSPAQLIFLPSNYNIPKKVTVQGVDDDEIDGSVIYQLQLSIQSVDPDYEDVNDVYLDVTNLDNESVELIPDGIPGVLVSPVNGLKTTEKGGNAGFEVVLKGEPLNNVRIPVVSGDLSEGKTNVSELIFTSENWDQKQTVTVTGVDDTESDGDVAYSILLGPVSSQDNRYDGMTVSSVSVINIDDDPPAIPASFVVSTTTLNIQESGQPGKFTIVPGTKPIDDVVVTVSVTDPTEGVVKPSTLTFTVGNWDKPQTVEVSGVVDGIVDGSQTFSVEFKVVSTDSRFNGYSIPSIQVTSADSDKPTGDSVKLRIMAANITSGNYQAYSPGHGVHIFKAVQPDIVLIQEFNWNNTGDSDSVIRESFINTVFGPEFSFHRGNGSIPNGIISRYPIIESGSWASNVVNNRNWDWAVVDLPGPRELLAVSVHLHTDKNATEMPKLIEQIKNKMSTDSKNGVSYFVVIGGDFNTSTRSPVISHMSSVFTTSGPYPVDQNDDGTTNTNRNKPYDYLLCSPDWCNYEIPVEIGAHTGDKAYKNGHVFDSRVYAKTPAGNGYEIDYVPPVASSDSSATNMQHMAVIRDFQYTY